MRGLAMRAATGAVVPHRAAGDSTCACRPCLAGSPDRCPRRSRRPREATRPETEGQVT